ncbi:MAG TPA: WYL domain-containing protein [Mycobacteriales bacterium]|nr:WYL domain-containing protein [Mycobacteriales bacterium]
MRPDDRLSRLLLLVPYFLARPGLRLSEAAGELEVTEDQLREDLQLLFLCGLPGYGPGDLIDMSVVDDEVTITYDAGISRPLRLTADEATALMVALRALGDVPGLAAKEVVHRALLALETAAGGGSGPSVSVAATAHLDEETMRVVSGALDRGRALRLRYYTAGRDVVSERVVDPIRLLLVSGTAYLQAWCRRAEATRTFRIDRIEAASELDEPSVPRETPPEDSLSDGVFTPARDAILVTLRVGEQSRWITEYYPCEQVQLDGDRCWVVSLRANNLEWARRLVMGCQPDLTVISPPELADAVREHARAALAQYAR